MTIPNRSPATNRPASRRGCGNADLADVRALTVRTRILIESDTRFEFLGRKSTCSKDLRSRYCDTHHRLFSYTRSIPTSVPTTCTCALLLSSTDSNCNWKSAGRTTRSPPSNWSLKASRCPTATCLSASFRSFLATAAQFTSLFLCKTGATRMLHTNSHAASLVPVSSCLSEGIATRRPAQ